MLVLSDNVLQPKFYIHKSQLIMYLQKCRTQQKTLQTSMLQIINQFISIMNYKVPLKQEEYKTSNQQPHPPIKSYIAPSYSYGSWANSNQLKPENNLQAPQNRYEVTYPIIKNNYATLDQNNKKYNISPLRQYENRYPQPFQTHKQASKSPAKGITKDIPSGKLIIVPHNGNSSIENRVAADLYQPMESPKYFKRRSIKVISNIPPEDKGYITIKRTQNQIKQPEKYQPRQQIQPYQNYYISDLVNNFSNKNSQIYDHFTTIFKGFKSCNKKLIPPEVQPIYLPQDPSLKNRKTIVFDLDQTLIHCTKMSVPPFDVKLPVQQPGKSPTDVGFNIRPYAVQILQNLSKHFEIIVFTASHSYYANVILDFLDPERKLIHHRLFRQHCQEPQKGIFVKDLRVIPRSMSNMVLIDNASVSYCFQPENGIPIISYLQGKADIQLKKLEVYLMKMRNIQDVRSLNKKVFKTLDYPRFNNVEDAINELFVSAK